MLKKLLIFIFLVAQISHSQAGMFDFIFQSDRDWCRETLFEYGLPPGVAAKNCGADVDKGCMKDLLERGLAPGVAARNCS